MEEHIVKTPNRKIKQDQDQLVIPPSPLLKTIGFGTGVRVYKFTRSPIQNKYRSPWALKKIDQRTRSKQLVERMNWEAEILRKLDHPNIVGFRAYIKTVTGDALAMEQCTTSLGDLIEQRRDDGILVAYPVNIILKVGLDISRALNYLHNIALLLHCDIKSYNVLVKNDFEICKLCDFGVALPLKKDGTVDDELEYVGTPAWSAPEVKKCPQEITAKADVYSLGAVLCEMLTLTIPLSNETITSDSFEEDFDDSSTSVPCNDSEIDIPDVDEVEYEIIFNLINRCSSLKLQDRPDSNELETMFKEYLVANEKKIVY